MKRHGQKNGSDEKRVLSWGHDEERLVLRDRVQGVEHFDGDLNDILNKEKSVSKLTKTERAMVIGWGSPKTEHSHSPDSIKSNFSGEMVHCM
jgi:hypothetical protein